MKNMHFFEVVGTLLMRPSGDLGFKSIECVVVRTLARYNDGHVLFAELVSGHDTYVVEAWFDDWRQSDNMHEDETGFTGRSVDIALPRAVYDYMLEEGRHNGAGHVLGNRPLASEAMDIGSRMPLQPVLAPIAAVRVADRWVGLHMVRGATSKR